MKYRKDQGFTLVEVMVVVSISMILVGMGLTRYNDFRKNQEIVRAAENLATEFREVQKMADIGQRVACNSGYAGIEHAQLSGYMLEKKAGEVQINVYELCTDRKVIGDLVDDVKVPPDPDIPGLAAKPIYLRDGIVFYDKGSRAELEAWDLTFSSLSPQNVSDGEIFVIKSTKLDKCIDIIVSELGDITVDKDSFDVCL